MWKDMEKKKRNWEATDVNSRTSKVCFMRVMYSVFRLTSTCFLYNAFSQYWAC